jgi:hypothetical protein
MKIIESRIEQLLALYLYLKGADASSHVLVSGVSRSHSEFRHYPEIIAIMGPEYKKPAFSKQ